MDLSKQMLKASAKKVICIYIYLCNVSQPSIYTHNPPLKTEIKNPHFDLDLEKSRKSLVERSIMTKPRPRRA